MVIFHGMNHEISNGNMRIYGRKNKTLKNTRKISGDSTWMLLKHRCQVWDSVPKRRGSPTTRPLSQYASWPDAISIWETSLEIGCLISSGFVWEIYKQSMFWMFFFVKLLCFLSMFPSTNSGRETMGLIWRPRTGKNTQWSSPTHSKNIDLSKGI